MAYKFFDKKTSGSGVIMKLNKIINLQMNFRNQLLEDLKKEEFILDLRIIFGVQILQICN